MQAPDEGHSYGGSIRERRQQLDMNQVDVADALGITAGHLSHLENAPVRVAYIESSHVDESREVDILQARVTCDLSRSHADVPHGE